ncbi:MAG: hypothetical protein AAFV53_23065, partial [Myxococcota bacterium]
MVICIDPVDVVITIHMAWHRIDSAAGGDHAAYRPRTGTETRQRALIRRAVFVLISEPAMWMLYVTLLAPGQERQHISLSVKPDN